MLKTLFLQRKKSNPGEKQSLINTELPGNTEVEDIWTCVLNFPNVGTQVPFSYEISSKQLRNGFHNAQHFMLFQ